MNVPTSLTVISITVLIGCSSEPNFKYYEPIQVYQPADPNLSCIELSQQLAHLDNAVTHMTEHIDYLQDSSQQFQMLDAFSNMMGTPTYADAGAQMTSQDANDVGRTRGIYQQRRDVLIKQYYAKRCSDLKVQLR